MQASSFRRHGFTLVELLVVIAIIGILVALLLPAVQSAREASRRSACLNNLKQVALAIHNYHDSHLLLPPGAISTNETSWHVHVLPYLERQNLYDQFTFAAGAYTASPVNQRVGVSLQPVKAYLCPSSVYQKMVLTPAPPHQPLAGEILSGNQIPYTTHYYGILGARGKNPVTNLNYDTAGSCGHGDQAITGVFGKNSKYRLSDVIDGTSQTFLIGEISWGNGKLGTRYRSWMRGTDSGTDCWIAGARNVVNSINTPGVDTFNDIAFGSMHTRGTHFAFCDASARFVRDNVDLSVYRSTATRNGGENRTLSGE